MAEVSSGGEKERRPISAPSVAMSMSKGEFIINGFVDRIGGVTAKPRSLKIECTGDCECTKRRPPDEAAAEPSRTCPLPPMTPIPTPVLPGALGRLPGDGGAGSNIVTSSSSCMSMFTSFSFPAPAFRGCELAKAEC